MILVLKPKNSTFYKLRKIKIFALILEKLKIGRDNTIFNLLDSLIFSISYFMFASIGVTLKFITFNIIALLSFNNLIQFKNIWNKKNIEAYLFNAWSFVIGISFIIIISIIY